MSTAWTISEEGILSFPSPAQDVTDLGVLDMPVSLLLV
jgi:hypothetical protein